MRCLMKQSIICRELKDDFQYWFPNTAALEEFDLLQHREDFDYYRVNGNIPFYNRDGNIVFENIDYKLINLSKESEFTSEESNFYYQLDEELYIKLLPVNKLFRVLKVKVTNKRLSKI